ncbi:purine-binding chemotaxis protein CheW [Sulfurihydrogenibium azorense Az-Fu1]|jgi:purine-binding chemotaxis protein CheW|uniref:Purine-binding chemotaxis protein CheW n=1 Tax=Sulfurihydrogenibium azorense (strain DSM 15241 / OCM 825 / Az-Fu1) TaxID=204536 RepID=C1DW04_SULAA|nr:chemotaxis protein CheW [Sulfurihydrogenibium azorense]ACN98460.1 purine-binding chemotaxis protein CheW [Sulfurihydrogenibium azorense Az-Fu1]
MSLVLSSQKKPIIYGQDTSKILEFLGVYLEDEFIGISLKNVLEISKILEIFPVPLTQHYIKGVINLRGEILPVVSVKEMVGVKETKEPTRLIVLETNLGKLAILVDSVYGVIKIPEDNLEPNPMTSIYSDYLSNVALTPKGFISIIDLDKLFPAREE